MRRLILLAGVGVLLSTAPLRADILVIDDHFANGNLHTNAAPGIGHGFDNTSQGSSPESWTEEVALGTLPSNARLGSRGWSIGSMHSNDEFAFFNPQGVVLKYKISSLNYVDAGTNIAANRAAIGLASNKGAFIWDSQGAGDQDGLFLGIAATSSGPYGWEVHSRVDGDTNNLIASGSFNTWRGEQLDVQLTVTSALWSFIASDGTTAQGGHASGFWSNNDLAMVAAGVQRGNYYEETNDPMIFDIDQITVSSIPEPSALALLGMGMFVLGGYVWFTSRAGTRRNAGFIPRPQAAACALVPAAVTRD